MNENVPKRPALRYYGGKFAIGKWIISHFPPHDHYVELCFGAGSVLLQKPAVKLETVNDLNGRVVNYFRTLRERPAELIAMLELTPWAREEYIISQKESGNDIEDARRFHIMCWMSISGGPLATGFRAQNSLKSRYATPTTDLIKHDLWTVSKRLRNVQILNEDAVEMIDRYKKADDALIYFDPPYVASERSRADGYADFEVNETFHIEAARKLRELPGFVVVSGYACDLYADLYDGWYRVDRAARTNSGSQKTESLWLSPRTWRTIKRPTQASLF